MASSIVSAFVVAFSVVAVLTLISALRKVKARGEWTGTATFGAAMVLLTAGFVEVFVTYLGLWTKQRNAYRTTTWIVPDMAHQAMRVLVLLLGVIAIIVFVVRFRRTHTAVNFPAVLFLLVGVVSGGSALLHGDNPFRPLSLVFLAVVLACTVAPRGLGIHIGIGAACMIVAIASGFTFLVHKDFSVFACTTDTFTADKCGLLGFNFRGILENENAIAMFLTLGMPLVYIGFGSWEGMTLSAYILCLTLLTGSRSGMTAAAVTFLALILLRPNIRQPTAAPIRSGILGVGLAGLFLVGSVLPFLTNDPTAFHARASLWLIVRNALSNPDNLLYGTGTLGWQHVRDSGLIDVNASYSVHNQWLQVLYSTGLIGLALFLAALGILLWQARPNYLLVVGCVLVPVFVLGVSERPWPTDTCDWLNWAIPAVLLCYPVVRRSPSDGDSKSMPAPGETEIDALELEELSSRIWRDTEVAR
jgi:hypothetical protein